MPQPRMFQSYQRRGAKRLDLAMGAQFQSDLEAAKSDYEALVGQRISRAVFLHRASQVMKEHVKSASALSERDALSDLSAGRGYVYPNLRRAAHAA
jgi:hypothetical protein